MKYSKPIVDQIIKSVEEGMPNKYAAQGAGIDESTFYEWAKKPDFSKLLKKAEASRVKKLLDDVIKAITPSGDPVWQARAWLLERLDRATFHLPTAMELDIISRLEALEKAKKDDEEVKHEK